MQYDKNKHKPKSIYTVKCAKCDKTHSREL